MIMTFQPQSLTFTVKSSLIILGFKQEIYHHCFQGLTGGGITSSLDILI